MFFAKSEIHSDLSIADTNPTQRWFAVYTLSRHEKRVAQYFQMQQIENLLPLYTAQRKWKDGSKHDVQFPLFPNYLFVRITRKKRVSVLGVPGVLLIVGGGNESFSVSDNYMQLLQEKMTQGKVEPHPYLATGEMVRIRSGAMTGMEGVLVRKKSGFRVVVTLELIKRSVAVELDIADLEPCDPVLLSGSGTGIAPAA